MFVSFYVKIMVVCPFLGQFVRGENLVKSMGQKDSVSHCAYLDGGPVSIEVPWEIALAFTITIIDRPGATHKLM